MRTGSVPYQKFSGSGSIYEKGKGLQFINNIGKSDCLFIAVSFLLGRASIVGGLLPFGMAFYASTAGMNINRYVITAFILLGMVTRNAADQLYLTIAAMLLFKVFTIPLRIEKTGHNLKLGIVAFISTLIPEFVIAYMQGLLLYDVLMALFHGVIVFSLIFIYRNAMGAILEIRDKSVLTNEEVISVAILTALVLSGLSGIEVMGFALKNVLSILVILLCSYKFGSGVGAATGVTIGLIISINSPAAPVIVGSYAIWVIVGCAEKFGKGRFKPGIYYGKRRFYSVYKRLHRSHYIFQRDNIGRNYLYAYPPEGYGFRSGYIRSRYGIKPG
jgi:stage II sporulation protein E